MAGLIMDKKDNLYGTTAFGGGSCDCGTVFEVTPSGEESLLYDFGIYTGNGYYGAYPYAGLIMDTEGNLYGTTYGGGDGEGTVFEVTPSGEETVLYKFCPQQGCKDGANPYASLIRDKKGNFYSTTGSGGAYGYGTVFKVTP